MHSTNTCWPTHRIMRTYLPKHMQAHWFISIHTCTPTHTQLTHEHAPASPPPSFNPCLWQAWELIWRKNSRELQINKTACTLMCSRLLYLLTDFHFQLNWSFRKVTFIILKSMSQFAQQFIIFEKHTRTNKQTVSSVPLAFQVSDRLDQSGYW